MALRAGPTAALEQEGNPKKAAEVDQELGTL